MPAAKQYECPTGPVDARKFAGVLSLTTTYSGRVERLSKETQEALRADAEEMGLTFAFTFAPEGNAIGPVHGEPQITKQAYHVSAGANTPIHRLVVHTAECPCVPGATVGIGNYFAKSSSGGSAHYGTDPTTEGHWVHDSAIAWHAPPNTGSLGGEIAGRAAFTEADWKKPDVDKALRRMAARFADLAHRFAVPVVWLSPAELLAGKRGITGHVCVSRAFHQSDHYDPGPNFPVKRFLSYIEFYLEASPKPPTIDRTLTKGVQKAVHDKPADGHWDKTTSHYAGRVRDTAPSSAKVEIRALQKQLGITVDGDWGVQTNRAVHAAIVAVQAALHVPEDGQWGPRTQRAYRAARLVNQGK